MRKRKVLVWETLATVSGGQKMTLTIMDMLADKYEFCCLIPAKGMMSEELKKRNIPYVLMGDQTLPTGVKGKQVIFKYGLMSVKSVWKSLGVIHKYKPDILYAPGPAALPWSAVCGTLTHKPVIWHLHHIFLDGTTKKLLNVCGRWKSIREIIAVSNCVGDQIANEKAHEKVKVLYNPVNVEKYANGNATRITTEVESKLGRKITTDAADSKTIVIGHVALIQRSKKQWFTLKLIEALRKNGYNAVGVFAGECREPEYMDELNQKVDQYKLNEHVTFLGRRNDIPDLLKMIDMLIIPSAFEGFPLAGLEAAAAGVPVIACDAAGAEEFIRVSRDGVSFTEDDVASAVDAVGKILTEKEKYKKAGIEFAGQMSNREYAAKIQQVFKAIEQS